MSMSTGTCTVATGSLPADKVFLGFSSGRVLDSLSAHIAVIDRSGRIISVNDAWSRFTATCATGQSAAGVGSNYLETFGDLQHPERLDSGQEARQGIEQVFRGEIDAFELEFANLSTADSHWYLMRCTPMEDGEHAVICHFDITALKRSADKRSQREEQLEERRRSEQALLQRRKQEAIAHLASGIAHDFNNILAAIMGYSELVLKKEIDSESREYIEEVLKASHRAKELVQQILTFSRKKDATLMPMNMCTFFSESLHPLRASLPDNVTLSAYLDELPEATIRGNPCQLQQVFDNLTANSLQAMKPSGGHLKVTMREIRADRPLCGRCPQLEEGRTYAELSIQDTGKGIPAEYLDSIFEPYFTTRVPERGTGLGLAVVYGIIRRHGGDILVDSIPGISTAFSIYLPLLDPPSAGPCPDEIEKRRQPPPHVLIVDDDETILQVMRMTLERNGYTVTSCQFAREAITIFRGSPQSFDLVLCDLSMPNINGEMLARELKKLRHEIPVILCTGHSAETLGSFDISHINRILEKPVPQAKLLQSLKEALEGR